MFFSKNKVLEWSGVITAITYSLLVAMNIGAEFLGLCAIIDFCNINWIVVLFW